jgi:hypothetical protein
MRQYLPAIVNKGILPYKFTSHESISNGADWITDHLFRMQ